jgi:hypothetical protein
MIHGGCAQAAMNRDEHTADAIWIGAELFLRAGSCTSSRLARRAKVSISVTAA